jgi:hypothetical protein
MVGFLKENGAIPIARKYGGRSAISPERVKDSLIKLVIPEKAEIQSVQYQ